MELMPIADTNEAQGRHDNERLERTSQQAMARTRLELRWTSETGRHTDCLVAGKLNLWRDIFPPELEAPRSRCRRSYPTAEEHWGFLRQTGTISRCTNTRALAHMFSMRT